MKINTELSAENIQYLRQQQARLDKNIQESRGITEAEWLSKYAPHHLLALRVEIAEFINEARDAWKYWKKKPVDMDRLIDEAVDNIHFIMLHLNKIEPFDANSDTASAFIADTLVRIDNHPGVSDNNVTAILTTLSIDAPESMQRQDIQDYVLYTLALILQILDLYGFTTADIIAAYDNKNAENFRRIDNGY